MIQKIRAIELSKGLNESERKELNEFQSNVTQLEVYFKREQTFSHRYAKIKTNMAPLNSLALKVAGYSLPTFVITSGIHTMTGYLQTVGFATGIFNSFLLIPLAMNVGWEVMTNRHLKIAAEANVLIQSMTKKINESANNESLREELTKKDKPAGFSFGSVNNDGENTGFSFGASESTGFSFGQNASQEIGKNMSLGFSFDTVNNDALKRGFSFGASESTGVSFGQSASQETGKNKPLGFSFDTANNDALKPGFSFGASESTGFSFGHAK